MPRHRRLRNGLLAAGTAAWLSALPLLAGCKLFDSPPASGGRSPLQTATSTGDAVTLNIYWIDLPPGVASEPDENGQGLWDRVAEDRLPVRLREGLASNGLRAGVVGAAAPDALLRLLDPTGETDMEVTGMHKLQRTGVRRRTRQMRPGDTVELNASVVHDEAPVLVCRNGQVCGHTYHSAQGVYELSVDRAADGRTELRLAPQIRHGEQLFQLVSDETGALSSGSLRRPTEPFPSLEIAAAVGPGEMLLVTALPEAGSRLGGLLHGGSDGEPGARTALLVHLAGAPASRSFLPEGE